MRNKVEWHRLTVCLWLVFLFLFFISLYHQYTTEKNPESLPLSQSEQQANKNITRACEKIIARKHS